MGVGTAMIAGPLVQISLLALVIEKLLAMRLGVQFQTAPSDKGVTSRYENSDAG